MNSSPADEDDLVDISDHLQSLDKTEIYQLGLVLGIAHHRLKEMKKQDLLEFRNDVIWKWLEQVDRVAKKGVPRWEGLSRALEHSTIGQTGLAHTIRSSHGAP